MNDEETLEQKLKRIQEWKPTTYSFQMAHWDEDDPIGWSVNCQFTQKPSRNSGKFASDNDWRIELIRQSDNEVVGYAEGKGNDVDALSGSATIWDETHLKLLIRLIEARYKGPVVFWEGRIPTTSWR